MPYKNYLILAVIIGICLLNCHTYAQADSSFLTQAHRLFKMRSEALPTEKAYLQFDKPYYAAGDTIYFKAYLTEGEAHRLSGISGVLHVDLINTNNKIDQSIKLQLDSGLAWGDFTLPDSLPKGNYRIRAYTQWMRNNGEIDFFDKLIPIGSAKVEKVPESLPKQTTASLKPDIQFFPEGASLLSGIRSKVAFKAIGPNGLGLGVNGTITDNENNQVASFTALHLGMGYFYFTPEDGKTYTAWVKYTNGLAQEISLTVPKNSGIGISVDNDSIPKAQVRIIASKTYFENNKNKNYTLVICSAGLITTVNCKLDSPVINLDILKRKLHTGVARVTLFNGQNEPLSERLFFVQNYDRLDFNLQGNKQTYAKREKVNIRMKAFNRKAEPAEGNFSVSVTDESAVPMSDDNGDNILTYLLLTSELKGYIEKPALYFADTGATTTKNLDVLMLTQGYRHFTWKQVLDSTQQTFAWKPEKGIEITGLVKNLSDKPIANGMVTLIPSKGGPLLSSASDDKGKFRFSNLIFNDTVHFVLSAVNAKNKNNTKVTYLNDAKYSPEIMKNAEPFLAPVNDTVFAAYVAKEKRQQQENLNYSKANGIMLKQVTIRDKKPDDQYRTFSLAGAGHADQVMHSDELERIEGPLVTSLDGRLRGVTFVGSGSNKTPYLTLNLMSGLGVSSPKKMAMVIDGAEVDPGDINFLNAADVESVELLKSASASIYGVEGAGGVLIITTKQTRGIGAKDIVSIGVLPIAPMGFYKAREFYSPKYDNTTRVSNQRDIRSTIYWQPELKTDKDGNASFEYYNGDGTGTYRVVIEGIDKDGNIGKLVYRYKVE